MMLYSLFLSALVATGTPQSLLESADTFIAEENWQEAATALDEYVRTAEHPIAEAMYDRGVAHFNIGEYEIAATGFDNAMAATSDSMLKTYSAFNLGNAIYQQALGSLEGKGTQSPSDEDLVAIEDAKAQIKEALQNYRTSISSDPDDMDARANGELAWQMLQQLDQMQEQMEEQKRQEQQKQQQNDQPNQDKEDDSADQQEKQHQKQESDSEQEQQQQQEGEQSDKNQEQQEGEQSDLQNEQDSKQSEDQQEGQPSDQQNDETVDQQEPQEGELETTDEEMNHAKNQDASEKDEGERLSEEEANRLLQLIRDKEQQRRKELAARRVNRRVPVEKDW